MIYILFFINFFVIAQWTLPNIIFIRDIHLNKVLQKFSTARPSSSVAKHKLLRDTKKQQDVITSNRVIMTS